jgi:hypothetical protein
VRSELGSLAEQSKSRWWTESANGRASMASGSEVLAIGRAAIVAKAGCRLHFEEYMGVGGASRGRCLPAPSRPVSRAAACRYYVLRLRVSA